MEHQKIKHQQKEPSTTASKCALFFFILIVVTILFHFFWKVDGIEGEMNSKNGGYRESNKKYLSEMDQEVFVGLPEF